MYKCLVISFLLLANQAYSQTTIGSNGVVGFNGGNGPVVSSTLEEGYLRGMGAYSTGAGSYLQSLGNYEKLHESARKQYLENNLMEIQNRLILKERAEAKRKAVPDYITRENARLDMIERRVALEKRVSEMRSAGTLPKLKSSIGWKGHHFSNMTEFKSSPVYQEFLKEAQEHEDKMIAENETKQKRQDEALEVIRKYRKMSSVDIARQQDLLHAAEIIGK